MTSTATNRTGRAAAVAGAPRLGASSAALLVVAAGAWVATFIWARDTGNGPGTMGLGVGRFVAMWALMMTAMMLPSVARVPGPSESTTSERRPVTETFVFAAGYLLAWAATGVPAFGAAVLAGGLADHHPAVATGVAVAIFALAGLYQFSTTKRRSLEHCRVSLSLDGSLTTALGNGARYCGWCLACSWAAMALMIALGVMNIAAMVVLALVIYTERFVFPGKVFSRATGVAALAYGALVVLSPSLAVGLHQMPSMSHM